MLTLVKRLDKGQPLSYEEMDGNFDSINNDLSTKITSTSSSINIINAILSLRDGVNIDGDTLNKLRNLIVDLETRKINIVDIVNNLNTDSLIKPLSATQGKLLKEALDLEILNRTNSNNTGTAVLNSTIEAEANARIAADNLEVTNRTNADNAEIAARIAAITAEANARAAAITAEATARANADTIETNARIAADTAENINRNTAISTETNARKAADTALGLRIDNLLSNIDPVALDSLSEIVSAFQSADGNLVTSINTLSTNLNASLSNEIINRTNADTTNLATAKAYTDSNIATEVTNRTAGDTAQTTALNNEVTRATTAEASLQSAITTEVNNRSTAITTEVTNRNAAITVETNRATTAESNLQTALTTETTNRTSADSAEATARTNADATETAARIAADNLKVNITDIVNVLTSTVTNVPLSAAQGKALNDSLTSQVATLTTNLNTEVTNRNSAVTTEATARANAITTEVTNRDTAISTAIATEVTNRNTAISTEATNRTNADTALQTSLNTEITNRTNADTALGVRIDNILSNVDATALNSLAELVTAFQAADSNLQTSINNLSSGATSNLSAEITNRTNADTTNLATAKAYTDSSIATEVTNRNSAITTETNARVAADTAEAQARSDAITAEVTNRNNAINATMATEVTARTNVDNLKVNITDIVNVLTSTVTNVPLSAAQGKVLNDNLTAEISNRTTSVSTNLATAKSYTDSSIATEVTARSTAVSNAQTTAATDATNKANVAQSNAIAASAPVAHVGSTGTAHGTVTTTVAGFMLASDKVKIDAISGTNTGDETNATILSKIGSTSVPNATNAANANTLGSYGESSFLRFRGVINETAIGDTATDAARTSGVYQISYPTATDALLDIGGIGGSTPRVQLRFNYGDDIWFRAARDTETNWDSVTSKGVRLLHSGNFGSYSPSLTGSGASGNWNINSATATNVSWAGVTSKPTTVSGYGIVDAASLSSNTYNGGQFITELNKGTVSSGTVTFSFAGSNVQKLTVGGALTIALAGSPPTGIFADMTIELVNGGSAALTLPTINWILPATGAPASTFSAYLAAVGRSPSTLQSAGTDFIYLWTTNGGTTVYGKII